LLYSQERLLGSPSQINDEDLENIENLAKLYLPQKVDFEQWDVKYFNKLLDELPNEEKGKFDKESIIYIISLKQI
jgi:hypothetical protein